MTADLDRFDRMLLRFAERGVAAQTAVDREVAKALAPFALVAPAPKRADVKALARAQRSHRAEQREERRDDRPPVITSERGPRYVDRMTCPMCGVELAGIEYHGELMSGAKVHTIQKHSEGQRRTYKGYPQCLGAAMRVVFEGGVWKGAPT